MTMQKIFNNLGPNWKWASFTSIGTARVHTELPVITDDGVLFYNRNAAVTARCEAFDAASPEDGMVPQIWERTNFSNGPDRDTDSFGALIGYVPPPPAPVMPTQQMPAPAPAPWQTRLTTENGKLWDFAKVHENRVTVDALGGVSFGSDVVGVPRYAFDVVVDGVTHPIERKRSQPQLAPPEAGKPFTPAESAQPWSTNAQPRFDYQPAHPGLRDDGLEPPEDTQIEIDADTAHGWYDRVEELEKKLNRQRRVLKKAKARAHALLSSYQADGNSVALTRLQYMAIFGEQPE